MGEADDAQRYRELAEHFHACAELSQEERERYLSGRIADPGMREELRSLLRFHPPGPASPPVPEMTHPPVPESPRGPFGRRGRAALFILAAGLTATALVVLARLWMLGRMETELRHQAIARLEGTVDSRMMLLRSWAERQKFTASRILADPALVSHLELLKDLAEAAPGDKEKIKSSPSFRAVAETMSRAPAEIDELGFIVLTPGGICCCAASDALIGLSLAPSGATYQKRILQGDWIVSRPYPDRQFAKGLNPDYSRQVMFVAGPVQDPQGKVLAIGVFRFSPRREFYSLFPGGEAKLLAFDEKGLILNDYGEAEELRAYGVLAGLPEGQSPLLRLRLRDPGGDLRAGFRPERAPDSWAPTLMSLRATRGGRGSSLSEYRDLLGRSVLGAWTWIPEWDMGVGAEQPVDRVLAPTTPARLLLSLLLLVPLAFTAALLFVTQSRRLGMRRGGNTGFASYDRVRSIGRGAPAEVFLGWCEVLRRSAAVKILNHPTPDPATRARFLREAKIASGLGHPSAIQVFDYGQTPEGRPFYAMEYVEGITCAQLLALENPLPVARVVGLLRQMAGALEEAHSLGLLDRDLNPTHVMISRKGGLADVVKILDFGASRSLRAAGEPFSGSPDLLGAPAFVAPERLRSPESLDPRMDLYSFGAMAFFLVTGRNVFEGSDSSEVIYQALSAPRPSPSQLRGERLPLDLELLIQDCLEGDPDRRPASFQEVLVLLGQVEAEIPWSQDQSRAWWEANRNRLAAFL
jgi:hypothetical protein